MQQCYLFKIWPLFVHIYIYRHINIYIYIYIYTRIFIHSVFCLTTGPTSPPKRFLHIVRNRASSFKWEYPLLSLRSSSSFLRLLPRLLFTSISPFFFPSITYFWRQLLPKIYIHTYIFIHSFSILSDDRSKAFSKTIPPHSAI